MIQTMVELLPKIIGGVILFLLTNFSFKKYKILSTIRKFRKSIKVDAEINSILYELRIKYGFNRVSIIDYHNGTDSFSGFSFKYATMTYEKTDRVTKELITTFKDVPCSIMSTMLNELETTPKSYIDILEISQKDENINVTHVMYGVEAGINLRIGKSLINGCVSCVYTNNESIRELSNKEILDIKSYVQLIYLIRNRK